MHFSRFVAFALNCRHVGFHGKNMSLTHLRMNFDTAEFDRRDIDEISIDDEIDSRSGYVSDEDSYYSYDAEAEWEESKAQINALFSLVIFPFVGRWLGKKFSFWRKLEKCTKGL